MLEPMDQVITEMFRSSVRECWLNRKNPLVRDTLWHYIGLLRIREGKRVDQVIKKVEDARRSVFTDRKKYEKWILFGGTRHEIEKETSKDPTYAAQHQSQR